MLNEDSGYPHRPEDISWIPGAKEAIKLCNRRGWLVFVVTNQSGVARGMYGEDDVRKLHAWMAAELANAGAWVTAWEYCPCHPDAVVPAYRGECPRRKPGPGMILDCMARWRLDPARSFMIGDRQSDLDAAKAADIAGHLFSGGDLVGLVDRLCRPCR